MTPEEYGMGAEAGRVVRIEELEKPQHPLHVLMFLFALQGAVLAAALTMLGLSLAWQDYREAIYSFAMLIEAALFLLWLSAEPHFWVIRGEELREVKPE